MNRKTEHFLGACFMYAVIVFALTFSFLVGESSFEKRNPFFGRAFRVLLGLHVILLGIALLLFSVVHPSFVQAMGALILGALLFVSGRFILLNSPFGDFSGRKA